jgi:hypothetical protein
MLWTAQDAGTPRVVNVTTTAFSGGTTDRVYTNNHEAGCGFKAMANGATGYAVFEVELGDDATGIVRYGKTCGGTVLAPASRTVTTRSSDGLTWTVTGTTGVHCRKIGKNRTLTEVGTAGPFSATLVATP